ncbi:MAG TPA: ribosome biogenesis GTPase Der [Acholeplasma sp.]|jgi:GTP-binding protein|nr:ribosome biogenesis GTPase Der [Acholeplasma sp.]
MAGVVAIIGRPNVGKSSLFNRIIGERLSITDDVSGITRDRLYAQASWLNQQFSVIDTGGIILKDEPFSHEIRMQAEIAIKEADVIIMVVDITIGATKEDEDVIRILQTSNKPVIVAVNKVDNLELSHEIYEFYKLGVDHLLPVSSIHGLGIGDLLDLVVSLLPKENKEKENQGIKYSLVGEPNVGKSTLVNAILGEKRAIVSSIPGTTTDAVDTSYKRNGKEYVVIDTAGLKKEGKLYENLEKYSFLRAMRAIERSDLSILVLDATKPLTEQTKRIAGYIKDYNRAMIIVYNKWDLVTKDSNTMKEMTDNLYEFMPFLWYVPVIFLSAFNKERINLLLDTIDQVYENYTQRINTSLLNDIIMEAVVLNPPSEFNQKTLKVYYATQEDIAPPSIVLFVNEPSAIHFSYKRYLENKIRENFDFTGAPLKITLRKKDSHEL